MSWQRIVGYGLLYWIVGAVLTMAQIFLVPSLVIGWVIFYGFVVVGPLLFCWPFFQRMLGTPSWQQGLRLAVSWIVLFSVLDGLVFLWWLEFSIRRYFSWPLALAYVLLAIVAMVMAHAFGEARRKQGPEGLA